MTFLHGAILLGLFALIIPPIVHLLNRRRYDVVDWAAMQFLQISRKTRQKVMFEELLLMLLRVVLIAALVLAVAAPVLRLSCVAQLPAGERLARLAGQTQRDIVLVIDGSYSMDCRWEERTAHEAAKAWAGDFLKDLGPGDRVAIVQAKQQPIAVLGLLTADPNEVRARLEQMPRPRGGVNWQKSMHEAQRILAEGQRGEREIVILTDGQRQGWADPRTIRDWELLALGTAKDSTGPRIFVVNVVPDRPDDLPNWSVGPIRANRAVATVGREVTFKFDLRAILPPSRPGEKKSEPPPPPPRVDFKVDEEPAGEKNVPRAREASLGIEYKRSFGSTGSHLVSALIGADALPGDNQRDFAIDVVPAIPVLLVDGEKAGPTAARSSDYFRLAVAPANHPQPSFLVRTIAAAEFTAPALLAPVGREPWTLPRVLVLHDVAGLTDIQNKLIEDFLKNGGGVLVLPGPHGAADSFNRLAFRDGDGWLPARLLAPGGDDRDLKKAAFPVADGLDKTFLEIFKEAGPDSFLKASFSRWWKLDVSPAGAGNVVARLSTGDPLFVEKSVGKGRALLAAVPLDDSWRNDLLRSHDFVRLCHESLFHLAGARSAEVNLEAGQEIIYQPTDGEPPSGVSILLPDGRQRRVDVPSWPLVFDETRETGVYKLTTDSGRVQYYVVQPDGNESILTPCSDQDRKAVASLFPAGRFTYEQDRAHIVAAMRNNQSDPELGWLCLLFVIGLLAAELAVTRALVKRNPPAGV